MPKTRSKFTATVGARIRDLRHEQGLTQADLAHPKYTKAYISMLESGRTRASMKALEHIADRLGVTPAVLLEGDDRYTVRAEHVLRTISTRDLIAELARRHGQKLKSSA